MESQKKFLKSKMNKMNLFQHHDKGFTTKNGKPCKNFAPIYADEETERMFRKDEPVVFDQNVLLFCDSNGLAIRETSLHKSMSCKKFFCPTFADIVDLMNKSTIQSQPERLLIMAGTDDFGCGDTAGVIENIDVLFDIVLKKFPSTIVAVSSVLPRKRFDPLNREVKVVNRHLEARCEALAKFTYMDNNDNINSNMLCDSVHLNETGTLRLISNIRFYLFGQIEFPKTPVKNNTHMHMHRNAK